MKQSFTSTTNRFFICTRRGTLLLVLGATGPAAWGQSFGPATSYSTGSASRPFGVAISDMNGDGRLDIVTANYLSSTVGVLLGQAGGFAPVNTYAVNAGNVYAAAVADLNGDNRMDIVTANYGADNVGVLLGQASGFAPVNTYSTGFGSFPVSIALGDVNADGRLDLVTANNNTSTAGVMLGLATGGFAASTTYFTGTGSRPQGVALGDVNGDGKLDIITANLSTSNVGVLLGVAGGFAPVNNYFIGANTNPVSVAIGDLNNDGRLDIVTANGTGDNVGVLLGITGSSFAAASIYNIGTSSRPYGIALGDINGDGHPDIITGNAGANTVSVLPGIVGGFATAAGLISFLPIMEIAAFPCCSTPAPTRPWPLPAPPPPTSRWPLIPPAKHSLCSYPPALPPPGPSCSMAWAKWCVARPWARPALRCPPVAWPPACIPCACKLAARHWPNA
jgi:hypothetical protein